VRPVLRNHRCSATAEPNVQVELSHVAAGRKLLPRHDTSGRNWQRFGERVADVPPVNIERKRSWLRRRANIRVRIPSQQIAAQIGPSPPPTHPMQTSRRPNFLASGGHR
jgi:hypothetical protein